MNASRLLAGVALAAAVVAFPLLALTYSSGAPSGYAGPSRSCISCHGEVGGLPVEVNSGTGDVSISTPGFFAPGDTVLFTIHVENTTPQEGPEPVQGFEISVRDAAATTVFVGSYDLAGSTDVQFAQGDDRYVTHTAEGNLLDTWTVKWVAPTTDVPPAVTVYVSGNAANGNGNLTDDYIYTDNATLVSAAVANEPGVPSRGTGGITLGGPSPNPTRADSRATYTLDRATTVAVSLLDGRGRTVRVLETGARAAGTHVLRLGTDGLAPGVYFLVVATPEGRQTRPLTVAR